MTREEAKQLIPIIKAYSEGKTIQVKYGTTWLDSPKNVLSGIKVDEQMDDIRIKPEPKYRPFKDAEECWNEMLKHQPFGWIRTRDKSVPAKYIFVCDINNKGGIIYTTDFTFNELFQYYTFTDGHPFGIKEEEQIW